MEGDEEHVQFMSPNGYPNLYPNNGFKYLDIRVMPDYVIAVTIASFETQRGDYVHIGDGVDSFHNNYVEHEKWLHLTGQMSDIWDHTDFISNSSSLKLIFTSDWSNRGAGFSIKCSTLKIKQEQDSSTYKRKYLPPLLRNYYFSNKCKTNIGQIMNVSVSVANTVISR